MIRAALILSALLLTACAAPAPVCTSINPYHLCHRWSSNGAGGMAQAPARGPSESNNPAGVRGGGQVGNPANGPGKGEGAGPGKGPGKGHGHGGHKGHGKGHGGKGGKK